MQKALGEPRDWCLGFRFMGSVCLRTPAGFLKRVRGLGIVECFSAYRLN